METGTDEDRQQKKKAINSNAALKNNGKFIFLRWDLIASFLQFDSIVSVSSTNIALRNATWDLKIPTSKNLVLDKKLTLMLTSKRYRIMSIKIEIPDGTQSSDFLSSLQSTRILHLDNFSGSLTQLSNFQSLMMLKLDEIGTPNLDTALLPKLSQLEHLDLSPSTEKPVTCEWDFSGIRHCPKLRSLRVTYYPWFTDLSELLGPVPPDWTANSLPSSSAVSKDRPAAHGTGHPPVSKGKQCCAVCGPASRCNAPFPLWCCLEELDLAYCENLAHVKPLGYFSALRSLNLAGTAISGLDVIQLRKLTCLQLSNCRGLKKISGIEHLHNLEDLKLVSCYSLRVDMQMERRLFFLHALENILYLDLSGCWWITDLTSVGATSSLKQLRLASTLITNVEPLGKATNLRLLDLAWCQSLTSLVGLEQLSLLECLNLEGCPCHNLSPLVGCSNLRHLDMAGAVASSFAVLDGCKNLVFLDLCDTGLTVEETMNFCKNLPILRSLTISSNPIHVEDVPLEYMGKINFFPRQSELAGSDYSSDPDDLSLSDDETTDGIVLSDN